MLSIFLIPVRRSSTRLNSFTFQFSQAQWTILIQIFLTTIRINAPVNTSNCLRAQQYHPLFGFTFALMENKCSESFAFFFLPFYVIFRRNYSSIDVTWVANRFDLLPILMFKFDVMWIPGTYMQSHRPYMTLIMINDVQSDAELPNIASFSSRVRFHHTSVISRN